MARSPLRTLRNGSFLPFYFTLFVIFALVYLCGCTATPERIPVEPASPLVGNQMKMTGQHFSVIFISGNEVEAGTVLAVLEKDGVPLYTKYLGIEPHDITVYLAEWPQDYLTGSGYPFEQESVSVGAVSVNNGIVFAYLPPQSNPVYRLPAPFREGGGILLRSLLRPYEGWRSCINDRGIVWGGAYASVEQYLGPEDLQYLPYFLREGLARYTEYRYLARTSYYPKDEILFMLSAAAPMGSDGRPALMPVDMMERRCTGPSGDWKLSVLCREEPAYTLSYISGMYGTETLASFLPELKRTHDWRLALSNVTGNDADAIWREMIQDVDRLPVQATIPV